MRRRVLSMLVVAGLLAVACGGAGGDGKALTVAEYATWCGERDDLGALFEGDAVPSWGEYADAVEAQIDEAQAIRAPSALSTYHRAGTELLKAVQDAVQQEPADEPMDRVALLMDEAAIAASMIAYAAETDLPDDVRTTLTASGCLDKED